VWLPNFQSIPKFNNDNALVVTGNPFLVFKDHTDILFFQKELPVITKELTNGRIKKIHFDTENDITFEFSDALYKKLSDLPGDEFERLKLSLQISIVCRQFYPFLFISPQLYDPEFLRKCYDCLVGLIGGTQVIIFDLLSRCHLAFPYNLANKTGNWKMMHLTDEDNDNCLKGKEDL
jgi:hypothetical protein